MLDLASQAATSKARCPKLAVSASIFAQFDNSLEHNLQSIFLLINEHEVMVCLRKRRSSKVNLSLYPIALPALLEVLPSALGDHNVRAIKECFNTHLRRI